jgi:hypothetical protein
MINNIWAVMCTQAITDRDSGHTSLINCVNTVGIAEIPFQAPPFTISSLWMKDEEIEVEIFSILLEFTSPSKGTQQILKIENISVKNIFHRLNFNIGGMPIKEFGMHQIVLKTKKGKGWVIACKIPLLVHKIDINHPQK